MNGRIIDLNKFYRIVPSGGGSNDLQFKTITETVSKGAGTYLIPSGIYNENVTLENNVNLIGNGLVKINGKLTIIGDGVIDFIECDDVILQGRRSINRCSFGKIDVIDGYMNCHGSNVSNLNLQNSQFVMVNCVIGGNREFNVILNHSSGLIESSNIEGSTLIRNESILDCRQTSIVGENDLFVVEEYISTLQLFNCVLYGNSVNIKTGAGTSIRGNCIALSNANQFEGGENIKVENV